MKRSYILAIALLLLVAVVLFISGCIQETTKTAATKQQIAGPSKINSTIAGIQQQSIQKAALPGKVAHKAPVVPPLPVK